SKNFFLKNWPQVELDGLYARAIAGTRKVILPVWHNVTKQEVYNYSPTLADLVGLRTTDGIDKVAVSLKKEIREEQNRARSIIQDQSSSDREYENGCPACVVRGPIIVFIKLLLKLSLLPILMNKNLLELPLIFI